MIIKPIPGFTGYFASNLGHILSNCSRGVSKKSSNLRILKPGLQSNKKYLFVNVKNDKNIRSTQRVHRLICLAFYGNPPKFNSTVSHLDGNAFNNKASNLRWESLSDNFKRKYEHGTDDNGINNSRAKIDLEILKEIRFLLEYSNLTHKEIGKKYNLGRIFITKIANGYRYKGQG